MLKPPLLILLLLLAQPLSAQGLMHRITEAIESDVTFSIASGATVGLDIADYRTTQICVKDYPERCREANVFLVPLVKQHGIDKVMVGTLAVKLGLVAGLALVRWQRPDWKFATSGSMLMLGGVQVGVVASNLHTLQGLQGR